MAFIVETGSGVVSANALCSIAYFVAFHEARGNTDASEADEDAIATWIIRATDYLQAVYGQRWAGQPVSLTQSLAWPRNYVYLEPAYRSPDRWSGRWAGFYEPISVANTVVPDAVQRACAILADRVRQGDELLPDLEQQVTSEEIGPIKVTYDRTSPQRKRYAIVDALLAPYLTGSASGIMVPLVRG